MSLPVTPSFRLDGKRAIVTGAGRGIGAGAAAALADAGAAVTLVARSENEIEAVAEEIRSRGGQAQVRKLDICDVAAVKQALGQGEHFHILVNNAGTNRPKPFATVVTDDYDAVMDLNVRAAFFVTQAVAARMVEGRVNGSIINISSQMGHVGSPGRAIYCTSKFAIEGLTKALAVELAPSGIRVNSLCPTFIETPMTAPYFKDETFRNRVLDKILLGRIGRVEDLMGAIVFLASDASALMTGSSVLVDGGWTAE